AAALGQDLRERLEQRCAVRRLERVRVRDCRLDDAGPGFGMQALERKPHRTAQLEQTLIEIGMDRRAQQRIAEISRRDGPQVAIMLVAHRMRRLLEQEEL